jgi:hypothetical protein
MQIVDVVPLTSISGSVNYRQMIVLTATFYYYFNDKLSYILVALCIGFSER